MLLLSLLKMTNPNRIVPEWADVLFDIQEEVMKEAEENKG